MPDKRVVFLAWVGAVAVLVAAVVLWVELFAEEGKSSAFRAGEGTGSALIALLVATGLWFGAMALIRPARRWPWAPLVPVIAVPVMFMVGFLQIVGERDQDELTSDCATSPREVFASRLLPAGYEYVSLTPAERSQFRTLLAAMAEKGLEFRVVDRRGVRAGFISVVGADDQDEREDVLKGALDSMKQQGFAVETKPIRIGSEDGTLIQANGLNADITSVMIPVGCNLLSVGSARRRDAIVLTEAMLGVR